MKNFFVTTLMCLWVFASAAQNKTNTNIPKSSNNKSDFKSRTQFYGSGGMQIIPVYDQTNRLLFDSSLPTYFCFGGGGSYSISHSDDFLGLNFSPNVNLSLWFGSVNNRVFFRSLVQVPLFLTANIGARSTPNNANSVGAALGVGLIPTFFSESYNYQSNSGTRIFSATIAPFFISPSALAEFTLRLSNYPLILRVNASLLDVSRTIKMEPIGQVRARFGLYGLSFLYPF